MGGQQTTRNVGSDTKKKICRPTQRFLEIIGIPNIDIYFQNILLNVMLF